MIDEIGKSGASNGADQAHRAPAQDEVKPRLIRRDNGEWLAISPRNARFLIGVTASTENEASQKFGSVYKEWIALRDGENGSNEYQTMP